MYFSVDNNDGQYHSEESDFLSDPYVALPSNSLVTQCPAIQKTEVPLLLWHELLNKNLHKKNICKWLGLGGA